MGAPFTVCGEMVRAPTSTVLDRHDVSDIPETSHHTTKMRRDRKCGLEVYHTVCRHILTMYTYKDVIKVLCGTIARWSIKRPTRQGDLMPGIRSRAAHRWEFKACNLQKDLNVAQCAQV